MRVLRRMEISDARDHLVKTHFLAVGLVALTTTLGIGIGATSSFALTALSSVGVTVIGATSTATLARTALSSRADFFVSIFIIVFLIGPIPFLLLLYLLQSFHSLFILVFVLFRQGKIVLRL